MAAPLMFIWRASSRIDHPREVISDFIHWKMSRLFFIICHDNQFVTVNYW